MRNRTKTLSITAKMLIIITGSIVAFTFIFYFISGTIFIKSYSGIEIDEVSRNADRAGDAIQNAGLQLNIKLTDWAWWNDTYQFITDRNEGYIETNLKDSAILNLKMNSMVFVNATGTVIFAKTVDSKTGQEISSAEINAYVLAHDKMRTHDRIDDQVYGLASLPSGLMLIASQPILTSNGEGPIRGTFVFGEFLDAPVVASISSLTHLSIELYPYESNALPPDVASAKAALVGSTKNAITPISDNLIAGYKVLGDIDGKPVAILKIQSPRPIYSESAATLNLFTVIVASLVLAFGVLMMLLLDRFVISRSAQLIKDVQKISAGDLSVRVVEGAQDEIGKSAAAINLMLGKLAASQKTERESNVLALESSKKTEASMRELENSKKAVLNLLEDLDREKKSAEDLVVVRTQELSNEKARLLASINSLSLGFIIADVNNIVILKNPAIMSILEIEEEPQSLEDVAKYFKGFNIVNSCKECIELNKVIELNDISYGKKFLRTLCAPVLDKGLVIGYVFLVEDVTEVKVIERSRDEFFALASHELRTPLTAIRGNVEIMLDMYSKKIVDEDMREMLSDINESSVRLIDIVNDFLEASRLEQGKVEMKIADFDIDAVVAKVIRNLQGVTAKKNLSISYEPIEPHGALAHGDKNKIEQVMINLVGNALKFTRSGSIDIKAEVEGKFLKVSVSDTGVGIAEHNQPLLFRKFQQARENTLARDVTQSTGLGLYISRLLMDNMKGKIWLVKSELNRGSTFAFTLPLAA